MVQDEQSPVEGVEVRETGQGKFQVEVRAGGRRFIADEPAEVGGLGSGPTPYDLMAAALGSCTAMTLRLYAERKGWALQAVKVRVLHQRGGLAARDRFAREIVVDGELSPEQRRRLLEIANKCPVHLSLERGAEVITVLADEPLGGRFDPAHAEHMTDMLQACRD